MDQHFPIGLLPTNFWCGIDTNYPAIWAKHIEKILLDKKDSEFFKNLYNAKTTREFIVDKSHGRRFEWNESAISLLDWLLSDSGIITKFNKKSNGVGVADVRKSG